jgi:hypothetical protein
MFGHTKKNTNGNSTSVSNVAKVSKGNNPQNNHNVQKVSKPSNVQVVDFSKKSDQKDKIKIKYF